ncbi:hypothetical protein [Lactobacillus equicursoris]|uniref:hypothetical protein n=1 Tax=Lactobacillus equicursoris TaxID=420645 RepID=UPI001EE2D941|nr:hypothetical protein [Lactobacillus equicursoris]
MRGLKRKRMMAAFPEASFQDGSQTYVDRKKSSSAQRPLHEAIARKGRKQCRLIMHNGNWQKAEQKLSLYEFK